MLNNINRQKPVSPFTVWLQCKRLIFTSLPTLSRSSLAMLILIITKLLVPPTSSSLNIKLRDNHIDVSAYLYMVVCMCLCMYVCMFICMYVCLFCYTLTCLVFYLA